MATVQYVAAAQPGMRTRGVEGDAERALLTGRRHIWHLAGLDQPVSARAARRRTGGLLNAGVDLNDDDLDKILQCEEVVAVARVERKAGGESRRCNEQVPGAGASGLPSTHHDGGEDAAVGASGISVEGEWIEGGLGPLKPVLVAPALFGVGRGVRTGGQLGHGQGTDGYLPR